MPVAGQGLPQLLLWLSAASQSAGNLHEPKHRPSRYVDTIILQVFLHPETHKSQSHLYPKSTTQGILLCLPCKISCWMDIEAMARGPLRYSKIWEIHCLFHKQTIFLFFSLELLEIALTHLGRKRPGAEAFQRSADPMACGFVSWPVEPACGHVTATAARKTGINLLPKMLLNHPFPHRSTPKKISRNQMFSLSLSLKLKYFLPGLYYFLFFLSGSHTVTERNWLPGIWLTFSLQKKSSRPRGILIMHTKKPERNI